MLQKEFKNQYIVLLKKFFPVLLAAVGNHLTYQKISDLIPPSPPKNSWSISSTNDWSTWLNRWICRNVVQFLLLPKEFWPILMLLKNIWLSLFTSKIILTHLTDSWKTSGQSCSLLKKLKPISSAFWHSGQSRQLEIDQSIPLLQEF